MGWQETIFEKGQRVLIYSHEVQGMIPAIIINDSKIYAGEEKGRKLYDVFTMNILDNGTYSPIEEPNLRATMIERYDANKTDPQFLAVLEKLWGQREPNKGGSYRKTKKYRKSKKSFRKTRKH